MVLSHSFHPPLPLHTPPLFWKSWFQQSVQRQRLLHWLQQPRPRRSQALRVRYVASCVLSGSPGAFCCMPFPHHHYAEEFPLRYCSQRVRAQVGTRTEQDRAPKLWWQRRIELWILRNVTSLLDKKTAWFTGIIIDILGFLFGTYVRGTAAYSCVWMGAGERLHRGVWERSAWCCQSGLAASASWCWRRWRKMSRLLLLHLLRPNHLLSTDPILSAERPPPTRTRWDRHPS